VIWKAVVTPIPVPVVRQCHKRLLEVIAIFTQKFIRKWCNYEAMLKVLLYIHCLRQTQTYRTKWGKTWRVILDFNLLVWSKKIIAPEFIQFSICLCWLRVHKCLASFPLCAEDTDKNFPGFRLFDDGYAYIISSSRYERNT